jgi:membrane associated rhomboid family serine protease
MRSVFSDILDVFKKKDNQVIQLILFNVFLFLLMELLKFTFRFLPQPNIYLDFLSKNFLLNSSILENIRRPWTIFIFPFTNPSVLNVLFNGLAIFWFGNILSDFLGSKKTTIIYIIGAIVSVFFYQAVWGFLGLFNKTELYNGALYGASAGLYAIMFAAVALLPEYEIMFFRFFIKLRIVAITFLILSLLLNRYTGILNLGAASFGYIQIKLLRSGFNIIEPIENIINWISNLGKPKKKMVLKNFSKTPAGGYKSTNFFSDSDTPDQAEVDYLLDKINKGGGYESLTKEEKNRLFKASQKKD